MEILAWKTSCLFCIINTIFIIIFRLIWNLEEDVDSEGEGVSVAAIMSYMNDAIASENHLGKYIKWIFPNAKQKRKSWKVILEAGRKFQRVLPRIQVDRLDIDHRAKCRNILLSRVHRCVESD